MTQYFLHRISQGEPVAFDYLGSGASVAQEGDMFVIYESHTLHIRALAQLAQHSFTNIYTPTIQIKLSDIVGQLSFIHTQTESVVRSLKKKNRLLTSDDFTLITQKLNCKYP
jgi:hypothetical protein